MALLVAKDHHVYMAKYTFPNQAEFAWDLHVLILNVKHCNVNLVQRNLIQCIGPSTLQLLKVLISTPCFETGKAETTAPAAK